MSSTSNISRLLGNFLRWIFCNPLRTCAFMAILGSIGVWLLVRDSSMLNWNRVATGTVFGLATGIVYAVETKFVGTTIVKRLINGVVGLFTGCVIAFLLSFGWLAIFLAALCGFMLGITAKEWIYHINFP